jgi:hypothetical protein
MQEATRRRGASTKRREAKEASRRAEEEDRERRRMEEGCTVLLVGVSKRRATVEYVSDSEGLWVRSHGREVTTEEDIFFKVPYTAIVWNGEVSKLFQAAIAGTPSAVAVAKMLVSKFSSVSSREPCAKDVVDKKMVVDTIRSFRVTYNHSFPAIK